MRLSQLGRSAILGLASILVLASCQPLLDMLGLGEKVGTLKVRAYSESYAADTSQIDGTYPIDAILDVLYPDGSSRTVMTDELG